MDCRFSFFRYSVSDVELVFVVSFGFLVEFVGWFSFVVVVGLESVFELSVFVFSVFGFVDVDVFAFSA